MENQAAETSSTESIVTSVHHPPAAGGNHMKRSPSELAMAELFNFNVSSDLTQNSIIHHQIFHELTDQLLDDDLSFGFKNRVILFFFFFNFFLLFKFMYEPIRKRQNIY